MKYMIMLAIGATVLTAATRGHGAPPSGVATAKEQWTPVIKYITTAAEQVPEAKYSYRPVGTVRTFGQLIGHLAGTQDLICGSALGEKTGGEDDVEKSTTTKAGLVAALKKSNERCEKAYAMSDADAGATHQLFGGDRTGLWALMQNAVHDSEHYGNIVTYMRMMDMVPPSSQPTAR